MLKKEVFKKQKFEEILQKQWGDFLDHVVLMRIVMENVRDCYFKEITQNQIPDRHVKLSITKAIIISDYENAIVKNSCGFELWIEFTIPKLEGVVIGTGVYFLDLKGNLILKNIFGTFFKPKNI